MTSAGAPCAAAGVEEFRVYAPESAEGGGPTEIDREQLRRERQGAPWRIGSQRANVHPRECVNT